MSAADSHDLLRDWGWLVAPEDTPLFVSCFGDWVFGAPDGSLWALSVLEGDYKRIAIDADAIARAISYASEQPDDADVSEIIVRPTASPY